MLEWYRAREDYAAVIADSLALLRLAAEVAGAETAAPSRAGLRSARARPTG